MEPEKEAAQRTAETHRSGEYMDREAWSENQYRIEREIRSGGWNLNETQEPTHLHYYDDERVTVAIDDIVEELQRAEHKHPVWPIDQLRQTAIVAGEAGEALQASLHVAEGRGEMEALRKEIIQNGAMCLRWLINNYGKVEK